MYRDDLMTAKERFNAFLSGEPMDRGLSMPIVTSYCAKVTGDSVRDYQLDPNVMANSHIETYKKLKYDLIYLFTNCSAIAEAMGQELEYYDDEPAACIKPIIKSEEDLNKIHVSGAREGQLGVYFDAWEIIKKEIGDEVYGSMCFSGPLSTAATLRDPEAFIMDTYKNPKLCHKLLRMATDSCKNFIKEIVAKGAVPIILEPISTGSIFSPKMYDAFSAPYTNELVDYAHELGSPIALHICGKTNKIIGHMADSKANIVSFDICDLDIAKNSCSGKSVLLGNVTPATVLLFGPVEKVEEECKRILEAMSDYKPGFVLSTGCELPNKIPYEHLEMFMKASRTYGTNSDFVKN